MIVQINWNSAVCRSSVSTYFIYLLLQLQLHTFRCRQKCVRTSVHFFSPLCDFFAALKLLKRYNSPEFFKIKNSLYLFPFCSYLIFSLQSSFPLLKNGFNFYLAWPDIFSRRIGPENFLIILIKLIIFCWILQFLRKNRENLTS